MSLGIVIKGPEGMILAADSRVTLVTSNGNGKRLSHSTFDNATKVLTFNKPNDNIGVVTYGQTAIGFRTAQSFIPEFESLLSQNENGKLSVFEFADKLSTFFVEQWNRMHPHGEAYTGPDITFNVAGFDGKDPYGKVYNFHIPRMPQPVEQYPLLNNQVQFGVVWGGQREIVDRLFLGYDPRMFEILIKAGLLSPANVEKASSLLAPLQLQIPIQFMPLQDCVNVAILFIQTTINTQSLSLGMRGCGGAIDVAIITRDKELQFIRKKEIVAEQI